jgi:hypothetical protein
MSRQMMIRYGLIPRDQVTPDGAAPDAGVSPDATGVTPAAKTAASTNEISVINVNCRGLNLKKSDPAANDKLAYALEKGLQASPLFDAKETKLTGEIQGVDDTTLTFTFGVKLKLKHPLKL